MQRVRRIRRYLSKLKTLKVVAYYKIIRDLTEEYYHPEDLFIDLRKVCHIVPLTNIGKEYLQHFLQFKEPKFLYMGTKWIGNLLSRWYMSYNLYLVMSK